MMLVRVVGDLDVILVHLLDEVLDTNLAPSLHDQLFLHALGFLIIQRVTPDTGYVHSPADAFARLLWYQGAVLKFVVRKKGFVEAPEPGAEVPVQQDEHLGIQVEEVDVGQRLLEVLRIFIVQRLEDASVDVLQLLWQTTEIIPDEQDIGASSQVGPDGFELLASHIRIVKRNPPVADDHNFAKLSVDPINKVLPGQLHHVRILPHLLKARNAREGGIQQKISRDEKNAHAVSLKKVALLTVAHEQNYKKSEEGKVAS